MKVCRVRCQEEKGHHDIGRINLKVDGVKKVKREGERLSNAAKSDAKRGREKMERGKMKCCSHEIRARPRLDSALHFLPHVDH